MDIIAGHLLGDILLQNKWLARIKMQSVLGMLLHCLIYCFGIFVFTQWELYKIGLVFITHFLIDNFGIGKNIHPDLIKMGNPNNNDKAPEWLRLFCDQSYHIITLTMINKL